MAISLKQIYIEVDLAEPHDNHKPKPTIDTQKQRERNTNTALKKSIKPQGKRPKEEKNREELQK